MCLKRYLAAEERQDIIVKELLDFKSDEEYNRFRQRFHQSDLWSVLCVAIVKLIMSPFDL
mgnify:FL=1